MMSNPFDFRVLIRGGGEMASGIAHRLWQCHIQVLITEIAEPTAVCRRVAITGVARGCSKTAFRSAPQSRLPTLIRAGKRSIVIRFPTKLGPLAEGLSRRISIRTRGRKILPRDQPAIKSNR